FLRFQDSLTLDSAYTNLTSFLREVQNNSRNNVLPFNTDFIQGELRELPQGLLVRFDSQIATVHACNEGGTENNVVCGSALSQTELFSNVFITSNCDAVFFKIGTIETQIYELISFDSASVVAQEA